MEKIKRLKPQPPELPGTRGGHSEDQAGAEGLRKNRRQRVVTHEKMWIHPPDSHLSGGLPEH